MISCVEALRYRCLRYVRQPLDRLHVLVGPNASGKTTFLDVVAFLGRLVADGLEAAVGERTQTFHDLVWQRKDSSFELAIEACIPQDRRERLPSRSFDAVRYEVSVGIRDQSGEVGLHSEKLVLKECTEPGSPPVQRQLFPEIREVPATLLTPRAPRRTKTLVNKVVDGNDTFYDETGKGWDLAFKLGPRKSALANVPEDESKFPTSTWFKALLTEGIQRLVLNSALIRKASPPGQIRGFKPDGSNLPWVLEELRRQEPKRFRDWQAHVRTALPDLESIRTIERADDRHRYLVLRYQGGLEVPSWVASDGTLRLLALTLPAYLREMRGIYLIEEPENGIHPRAVETMFQSLSSVYQAQVLLATHSPVILSVAEASQVLCFARTQEGATDIVSGTDHPALKDWRGETNLSTLFRRWGSRVTRPVTKDLVVLVADKNQEFALRGILSRPRSLGVRELSHDLYVHPERDPGCFLRGHDFLRGFRGQYWNALIILDRQGCGQEQLSREEIESSIESRLRTDWDDRACAVVIDPELENWIWSDSPHVAGVLGWSGRLTELRSWLTELGLWESATNKPARPKEAVLVTLKHSGIARSSARYR